MRKILLSGLVAASALLAGAQLINVTVNGITVSFPAEKVGDMTVNKGETVTIGDRTFNISEIEKITVTDNVALEDNVVAIALNGDGASVNVADNIISQIEYSINGGNVTVTQAADVAEEITYRLSGETTNGSVTLVGDFKVSVELLGVNIKNPNGPALKIDNGKRTAIRVAEGTVNSLADGEGGDWKAALHCKGHLEFKQKGTLNVTGNSGHAIFAKEYIEIKNSKINVLGSAKDGINCNQYFKMESGTINIENVLDDGLQCSFKDDVDREAEDTATVTITGGTLNIKCTADAAKAIKADGDFLMTGGTLNATVSGGGIWDATAMKTKAASCVSCDGELRIEGGTLDLKATGGGGKGLSCDGEFYLEGGDVTIATSGNVCVYSGGKINNNYTSNTDRVNSNYKSSAKGVKSDGNAYINGGTINITTSGVNAEGIESKKDLYFNGGTVIIAAYDDGTNSSANTYINGGDLQITAKVGDGIDSNTGIYVTGGRIRVFGAGGSEQGFDTETTIAFTGNGTNDTIGGTFLAVGGGNSAPSTASANPTPYITGTLSVKAGQTVTISEGTEVLESFEIPASYTGSGSTILIGSPKLKSGTTYSITNGTSTISQAAKTSGGSTGPGGGGGTGGGKWPWM